MRAGASASALECSVSSSDDYPSTKTRLDLLPKVAVDRRRQNTFDPMRQRPDLPSADLVGGGPSAVVHSEVRHSASMCIEMADAHFPTDARIPYRSMVILPGLPYEVASVNCESPM